MRIGGFDTRAYVDYIYRLDVCCPIKRGAQWQFPSIVGRVTCSFNTLITDPRMTSQFQQRLVMHESTNLLYVEPN